jgi:transposase InsO family protein
LVNDALAKANTSRAAGPGTVIHSDHGSQFMSWAFTENVRRLGLVSSMGTVGDCYDNAPMESFWGSLQVELLNRRRWRTIVELAVAIADYIEHFYNPARRHSSLGYLTPNEFEHQHSTHIQAALS